ncbi:MAG TPA: hypothetical protein VNR40_02175, partial [Steroidobacter sp.]|nr:hypothetical protein [Steroidobacter sp.]
QARLGKAKHSTAGNAFVGNCLGLKDGREADTVGRRNAASGSAISEPGSRKSQRCGQGSCVDTSSAIIGHYGISYRCAESAELGGIDDARSWRVHQNRRDDGRHAGNDRGLDRAGIAA